MLYGVPCVRTPSVRLIAIVRCSAAMLLCLWKVGLRAFCDAHQDGVLFWRCVFSPWHFVRSSKLSCLIPHTKNQRAAQQIHQEHNDTTTLQTHSTLTPRNYKQRQLFIHKFQSIHHGPPERVRYRTLKSSPEIEEGAVSLISSMDPCVCSGEREMAFRSSRHCLYLVVKLGRCHLKAELLKFCLWLTIVFAFVPVVCSQRRTQRQRSHPRNSRHRRGFR